MCNSYPLPPSACDGADAHHPQQRHVARWLPDTPIKAGSRYRLLLSPPLAEVLHLCVVEWRPTSYAEWRGSSAARHLRLELALQRSPASPLAATYVQLRWTWEWRGWRRLKGALPAAHTAARAVGEQATARIAAAFAQGLHLAYHPAEAPPTTPALLANPMSPAVAVMPEPAVAVVPADTVPAVAAMAASAHALLAGTAAAEPAVPVEDI